MTKLENKVAIVTGGASGIGKATASLFVKEGAKVVIVDVNEKLGKQTEKELSKNCVSMKCDVSKSSDVKKTVDNVVKVYGKIDILVNNAGVYWHGTVDEMDEGKYDRLMEINLKGPFLCSKYVIPLMKKNKYGVIINIASELGIIAEPDSPAYCASKAGLIHMTKAMAMSHAKDGIRVNAVCPGPIDTPLLRNSFDSKEEFDDYVKNHTLLGKVGKPEDVANVCLVLALDESYYITGSAYSVDGGESLS